MSVWMLQIKFNRKYSKAPITKCVVNIEFVIVIEQQVLDTNAGKQLS